MSNQNSNNPKQTATVTAEQISNEQILEAQVAEENGYVCPLTINYVELEKLLDGKTLKEYVGDNLPKEEVERIETDFAIYKSNKK